MILVRHLLDARLTVTALLDAYGEDGAKWAAIYNHCAMRCGYPPRDEDWLAQWFSSGVKDDPVVQEWRRRIAIKAEGKE